MSEWRMYKREPKDEWRFPGTEENRTEEQARADREATRRAIAANVPCAALTEHWWK